MERLLDRMSFLEPLADVLQKIFGDALSRGGEPAKAVKDLLNGVWFEHPLHPALTDVPIGAWTSAVFLDLVGCGDRRVARASDALVGLGCIGAVGAALSGAADWQDTYGKERRTGLAHALLNSTALGLFATSFVLRKAGSRAAGVTCSLAGYAVTLGAAYLGGDLIFRMGTQVNRNAWTEGPEEWTAALPEADLEEGKPCRGKAGDAAVLLLRQNGRIYAMSAVCPHAGGPLDEGTIEGNTVICPWHASQFELASGSIVHGPATVSPPLYETRVQNGQVEVRRITD